MPVEIIARPHPLHSDLYVTHLSDAVEAYEYIRDLPDTVAMQVDGNPVPHEAWQSAQINDDSVITLNQLPQGGFIAIVAQIALSAIAPGVGAAIGGFLGISSTLGIQLITAGFTLLGSLAINALVPVREPTAPGSFDPPQISASIVGTRNNVTPFGPVPRLYGKFRYYPVQAANPITELQGNDQYLLMLLCLGYGPLEIGGQVVNDTTSITHQSGVTKGIIQIGDTDIEDYSNVEWRIGPFSNMSIFTRDIQEEQLSIAMDLQDTDTRGFTADNISAIRTTATSTQRINLDVTFPQGFFTLHEKNILAGGYVDFKIETRPAAGGSWTTVINPWRIEGPVKKTLRQGYSWNVTEGQYDVRLTRVGTYKNQVAAVTADAAWSALRSHRADAAWNGSDDIMMMEVRIKATDQLNGIIDRLSVEAQSQLRVWNGASFDVQTSRNPAWAYIDAITGSQVKRPVSDSRLDTTQLKAWADWCDDNNITYNHVHAGEETILQRVREICSTGQAAWAIRDGEYGAIYDDPDASIIQVLTPRNSSGFQSTRSFKELPHALRVRYVDENSWEDAERRIYRDGYNAGNSTVFEEFQTQGVTDADHAWRHGQYFFRQAILRPESYEATMDIENLVATRGDRVMVAQDVILTGLKWGRIKSITGSPATDIEIDEQVTMSGGTDYGVRIRKEDGTQVTQQITTVPGISTSLEFIDTVSGLTVGDLVLFGEYGSEAIDCKITGIEYNPDFSAQIRLVDAATDIHDYGTPPVFDPGITIPTDPTKIVPATPIIDQINIARRYLISADDGLVNADVEVAYTIGVSRITLDMAETRYRIQGTGIWEYISAPPDGRQVILDIPEGITIDIELRTRSIWGLWSEYATTSHTVIVAAPDDIPGLLLENDIIRWTYPDPPPDLAGFVVRYRSGTRIAWMMLRRLMLGS